MPNYAFNHVHHEAEDVERAVEFYKKVFDAKVDPPVERGGALWAYAYIGDVRVVITNRQCARTKLERYQGLDHFALITDDFDATLKRIEDSGTNVWVPTFKQDTGRRILFISGPDNIKIELMEKI